MFRYIIEALYGGRISPWDRPVDKESDRGKQSHITSCKADAFRRTLTAEQTRLFDDLVSEQHLLGYLSEQDGFVEGFRLGALLFIAATEESNDEQT